MKALSLIQPWATLIMMGLKNWETRSWQTRHRGALLIHASRTSDKAGRELWENDPTLTLIRKVAELPKFEKLPRGAIIGMVILHNVHATETLPENEKEPYGDFSPGRFAWLMTVKEQYDPIPCKGALGLWNHPAPVLLTR